MSTTCTTSLWRQRDFMKIWAGTTISLSCSRVTGLALPLIAAVALNATPIEMGFLAAARTIPTLLIGLFAGVWVDRHRRRSVMIAADLSRALILVTIPATALAGMLTIYQLYAVGFMLGLFGVFFDVACQAYLPSLIRRDQLLEAISKFWFGATTAEVAGPSLGGVIIQAITAPLTVIADVLSFLARAFLVHNIEQPEKGPSDTQATMLVQLREGISFTFGNPWLRAIIGCRATSNLSGGAFFALWILFATRELGLDAAALGLISGLGSVGAPIGALLGQRVAARLGVGLAIVVASVVGAITFVPFATPTTAIPLVFSTWLIGSFGWTVFLVNQTSLCQAITPLALQGRMNATMSFTTMGMVPLGSVAGGALAQMFGLREAIIIAAVVCVLSFPWVLFSPIRSLRRVPDGAAA